MWDCDGHSRGNGTAFARSEDEAFGGNYIKTGRVLRCIGGERKALSIGQSLDTDTDQLVVSSALAGLIVRTDLVNLLLNGPRLRMSRLEP